MITLNTPQYIGSNQIRITWSSNLPSPMYYVYIDGVLVTTTLITEYVFFGNPDTNYFIEVFDTSPHIATKVLKSNATICWFPVDGAEEYEVAEKVNGTWETIAYVSEIGMPVYSALSRSLEDSTYHQFRVRPIKNRSHFGDPLLYSFYIVRFPDAPDVAFSYDAPTRILTISEAS